MNSPHGLTAATFPTAAPLSGRSIITLNRVHDFICDNISPRLTIGGQRIGIALSGGPDSVALLWVGRFLGWDMTALHCNFKLRGQESDNDEKFVTELCRFMNIPLATVSFDTVSHARHYGESIEMAARHLRYEWFEQQIPVHNLAAIATGHHREDNIETFLLNAMRGCGINGLKGIPAVRWPFFRPLLATSREEILDLLHQVNALYVTDSTNAENSFQRNQLRNLILPNLEECFPGVRERLSNTISHISEDRNLFMSMLREKSRKYVGQQKEIDIRRMFYEEDHIDSLLFRLLDGDLSIEDIRRMVKNIGNSGKIYRGKSGREYTVNRGVLIPCSTTPGKKFAIKTSIFSKNNAVYRINNPMDSGLRIQARTLTRDKFAPRRDTSYAWFDAEILSRESLLIFRHYRNGDRIQPFGMAGTRLLSDIFADYKLDLFSRRDQWVVACGAGIIWLPWLKNSALYPVTETTDNILELHIENLAEK